MLGKIYYSYLIFMFCMFLILNTYLQYEYYMGYFHFIQLESKNIWNKHNYTGSQFIILSTRYFRLFLKKFENVLEYAFISSKSQKYKTIKYPK
jgi:hypothetical protein